MTSEPFAALAFAGALVALGLPGRRHAEESIALDAVPTLEAEGGS
jgi:hypothetical protein